MFLCVVQVDYIIIGQGISGTMLSRTLMSRGKSVLVVDNGKENTASKVASGVINPVTGRRIVRTWMIDTLLPFAEKTYEDIGEEIGKTIVRRCNIIDFYPTEQMQSAWWDRIEEEEYLHHVEDAKWWKQYLNFNYGAGEIDPCLLIDLHTLLNSWKQKLSSVNALIEADFAVEDCFISETEVVYKDIHAKKIIFCDGVNGFRNPYFSKLPFAYSKGEMMLLKIKGLPQTNILKQGINIVPQGDDMFWVGSSFEWEYEHEHPTEKFKNKVETQLKDWLKLPYEVIDHKAAIRPASLERRPFVGLHPQHPNVGILNGMGTKGCSLTPFFAHQLADHLLSGTSINPTADITRFTKVLSR